MLTSITCTVSILGTKDNPQSHRSPNKHLQLKGATEGTTIVTTIIWGRPEGDASLQLPY